MLPSFTHEPRLSQADLLNNPGTSVLGDSSPGSQAAKLKPLWQIFQDPIGFLLFVSEQLFPKPSVFVGPPGGTWEPFPAWGSPVGGVSAAMFTAGLWLYTQSSLGQRLTPDHAGTNPRTGGVVVGNIPLPGNDRVFHLQLGRAAESLSAERTQDDSQRVERNLDEMSWGDVCASRWIFAKPPWILSYTILPFHRGICLRKESSRRHGLLLNWRLRV